MVPAFLRSSGASAARRRVLLAVWVIPLIVASLRTLLAAPTAARSQLATNDPRPTNPHLPLRTHTHARAHTTDVYTNTRPGGCERPADVPFFPLRMPPYEFDKEEATQSRPAGGSGSV